MPTFILLIIFIFLYFQNDTVKSADTFSRVIFREEKYRRYICAYDIFGIPVSA